MFRNGAVFFHCLVRSICKCHEFRGKLFQFIMFEEVDFFRYPNARLKKHTNIHLYLSTCSAELYWTWKKPKHLSRRRERETERRTEAHENHNEITNRMGKISLFKNKIWSYILATREINIPIICQMWNSLSHLCRCVYMCSDIAELGNLAHTHSQTSFNERIKVDMSPPRIQICQLIIQC